jgi:hypothetical protein
MSELPTFAEDRAEIIAQEASRLGLTRRAALAAFGATALVGGGVARAQAKEVVLANFGGDAVKAMTEAFVVPYEKKAGAKMVIDGSGPSNGKIKTMVQAKNVTWDVVDSGLGGHGELGPLGLLEEIDYGVVDKSKVLPGFAYKYGVCNYMFSSVMAWDTAKVKQKPTLADFFDFKKYPGKRLMRKDSQAMYELALMADGVPKDKLYPARRTARAEEDRRDQEGPAVLGQRCGEPEHAARRRGRDGLAVAHTAPTCCARHQQAVDYSFDGGCCSPASGRAQGQSRRQAGDGRRSPRCRNRRAR